MEDEVIEAIASVLYKEVRRTAFWPASWGQLPYLYQDLPEVRPRGMDKRQFRLQALVMRNDLYNRGFVISQESI